MHEPSASMLRVSELTMARVICAHYPRFLDPSTLLVIFVTLKLVCSCKQQHKGSQVTARRWRRPMKRIRNNLVSIVVGLMFLFFAARITQATETAALRKMRIAFTCLSGLMA